MRKRNDKEYIKAMQKQIVDLKKYIVELENKVNKLKNRNYELESAKNALISMLFDEIMENVK